MRPDPIGQLGGLNLYLYVNNNPANDVDPLGLFVTGYGYGFGTGATIHPTGDSFFMGGTAFKYSGTSSQNCGHKKGLSLSLERATRDGNWGGILSKPWDNGGVYGLINGGGFFVAIAPFSDVEVIDGSSEIWGVNLLGTSIEITSTGFINIGFSKRGKAAAVYHLHSDTVLNSTFQDFPGFCDDDCGE